MAKSEKKYFLFHDQTGHSTATYTKGTVVVTHNQAAHFTVVDTGDGYEVVDTSPFGGTKKYTIDYGGMADLFAALKIFYHNSGEVHGEFWSVIEGKKI